MTMRICRLPTWLGGASLAALLALSLAAEAATGPEEVLRTYADIAAASYGDALTTAQDLRTAVTAFLAAPSALGLDEARAAWLRARVPYMQTEVYRFGNAIVDDWEGRVNAWPLDEGLLDYVAPGYGTSSDSNPWYTANLVANPKLEIGGRSVDAGTITPGLLQELQEADGVEANVATGYHAIEFMLWGQDLHGTDAGKGERPWTDYAPGAACSHDHCDRRGQLLQAATDLLVVDLEEMVGNWGAGGAARTALTAEGSEAGLAAMLTGFGSLAYGELAGERTKLGLLLHDPEEEHDCFADDTHDSHYNDVLGMQNVWQGRYLRVDGSTLEGPSLEQLVAEAAPEVAKDVTAKVAASLAAAAAIRQSADSGRMAYDQMLAEGNDEGNRMLQALVDALVAQTRSVEQAVAALGLEQLAIEGSDSLDNPAAVTP